MRTKHLGILALCLFTTTGGLAYSQTPAGQASTGQMSTGTNTSRAMSAGHQADGGTGVRKAESTSTVGSSAGTSGSTSTGTTTTRAMEAGHLPGGGTGVRKADSTSTTGTSASGSGASSTVGTGGTATAGGVSATSLGTAGSSGRCHEPGCHRNHGGAEFSPRQVRKCAGASEVRSSRSQRTPIHRLSV